MNSKMPTSPQPLCAAFAPLLPLLNAGELGPEQAASLRDHLATCAWCRVQLASYDLIDSVARRHYAGTPGAAPLFQREEIEKMLDEPTAPVYEPLPTHSGTPLPPRPRRLPAFSAVAAAILVAALAAIFFARQNATHTGGHITATPSAQGTIVEYPLEFPGHGPTNIIAGADGNLWFTDNVADAIGHITPAGHIQEFALPTATSGALPTTGSGVWGIARAADGKLWFTEQKANRIGSIDTNGKITVYPNPGRGQFPSAITVARDGTIWYTNANPLPDALVQFAPHGTTQFTWAPPVADARLLSITVGPDGNVWFTESKANRIGRVIPTTDLNKRLTAIKEFDLPTPASGPLSIITGPDGNLWFVERGTNRIGRITPTGEVKEYPVPTPNAGLNSITTGSDGNLWFTEFDANKIGRINPTTGQVAEFPIPTQNAGVYGITAGPDGNLWFTESHGAKVGYIHP